MSSQAEHRILQLLADQATEGLGPAEGRELAGLLHADLLPVAVDLDQAAAAVDLALIAGRYEELPPPLRDRVLVDAGRYFGSREQGSEKGEAMHVPPVYRVERGGGSGWLGRAGWAAAAACLCIAVATWWTSGSSGGGGATFARFAELPNLVRASWSGKEAGFEEVEGGVVWSGEEQRGFMRFVGLPTNDPRTTQYQLWIVDPHRDKHPVDGGVFDVTSSGEVIVPFESRLPVEVPTAFAITREKPGGVVVSAGPLLVVGTVRS